MSYSRKYAFLNALNLRTGIVDDDGISAEPFKEIPQKTSGPKHGSDTAHVKSVQRIISEIENCDNIYNFRKVVKLNQPFIDNALKNRNVANFTLIDDIMKNKERELNRRTNG
jgi:hypothetical protein